MIELILLTITRKRKILGYSPGGNFSYSYYERDREEGNNCKY